MGSRPVGFGRACSPSATQHGWNRAAIRYGRGPVACMEITDYHAEFDLDKFIRLPLTDESPEGRLLGVAF